jgi:cyanophycin synthetase
MLAFLWKIFYDLDQKNLFSLTIILSLTNLSVVRFQQFYFFSNKSMSISNPFDIFNFKSYFGSNPYLNKSAVVFDLSLNDVDRFPSFEDFCYEIERDLPKLKISKVSSYTEIFAEVILELSKLEMDLHIENYSIKNHKNSDRIAIHSIHQETTERVIETVRDWLTAIYDRKSFAIQNKISKLQKVFRASTYGGPTIYSLLRASYYRNIPTFHLPDEHLMQYGYGKYHKRGVATTFSVDSQIDSDFTTQKDDCKAFLENCGFPTPKGRIVYSLNEALNAVDKIGYPVAVKPVVGHKGIGVTANVLNQEGLEFAFEKAQEALVEGNSSIIIEQSITGSDFRVLCVGGNFTAAVERRPPYVIGDGKSTLETLIDDENNTEARQDTPISALGKIITDDVMYKYLDEQNLSIDTVIEKDRTVYLRKIANLSSGGVSIDVTSIIHPDNMILAQDIAQYFNLVCLGIDVIAKDISKSWKDGDFGIIEINAAPGVYMHLNPAFGNSVDVPGKIIDNLFPPNSPSRVPIITFNKLYKEEVYEIVNHILLKHPHWTIGSVCQAGVWLNHSQKMAHSDYNRNVKSLLRHPKLDLLIVEYTDEIFEEDGLVYQGSNVVILDNPTETEMLLGRDLLFNGTLIIKQGTEVSLQVGSMRERYSLGESESFQPIFLKEITRLILDLQ